MHLVVSGEGKGDIGIGSYVDGTFIPAPMYYLIDKVIEKKLDYSIYELTPTEITFIPKVELSKICKSIKSLAGKKRIKETGYFYKNALGLSKVAKGKGDDVIAILFRDADGTGTTDLNVYHKKIESIENAFEKEGVNGVAMIPNPKSEAWLICALKESKYQSCNLLEKRSGNDDSPNNLKKELGEILKFNDLEYYDINEMIKDEHIDIEKMDIDSFNYFREKLKKIIL